MGMLYKSNTGPQQVESLENRVLFSTINPSQFGAVPNDGNDDRNAIQEAVDHANKGDKIVFDAGTFNLHGQVKLRGGITLTTASGEQDALLDTDFDSAPGNGWVNGQNFAFKADDVRDLNVNHLKFKANGGIFNFGKADGASFTMNDFQWGYDSNYYNRHAFYISNSADGLNIDKNYFHDSESSDRNLEVWNWSNGSYSYNHFYKINDGGHIMNPGHNFHMQGNVGRLIHRMGIEIQQDHYKPAVWAENLVIEDNVFSDWNKPFWDSMGLSVPVAGKHVTIRNNYIKQNAFNGEWGEADSSGRVRGSYGIEAPQGPKGEAGGIVEGNTIISERDVMAVSAPGKDTVVRNNKFYGSFSWNVVGGEPGSLGYGSVKEKSNLHEKDLSKHPQTPKGSKGSRGSKGGRKTESLAAENEDSMPTSEPAPTPALNLDSAPELESTYLSDLAWASADNGLGAPERDGSNGGRGDIDGGPIRVNNSTYDKGLGVAGDSVLVYDLHAKYQTFFSNVGIDDSAQHKGQMSFEVWADGNKIYDSGVMRGNHDTESLRLNVGGVRELKLVTTGKGSSAYNQGDWAGARLQ
jgi:hypothetical protein